ncbi:hypothetical protein Ahy_A07g031128 [Arachis hypogaea]|uniref:Endonuclease/exonuclease/phosphatase domain-containing protein n=1 Tax=Arachis hypogaea TaxID=3818 RepID=A0A445C314_ARAHY|nr:hypothetical protein Ahy_A07g031128 [Arachis hypogaea]
MIILSWNYRGAASSAFCRTLKEFVGMHKPNVVILLETRCSGETAERTIRNCGFDHWHIKEAVGYSGGIWVMWKDPDLVINVIESKLQYDHMKVRSRDEKEWLLTAVKQADSPLWKEIVKLWPLLIENCNCNIGDGRKTLFWINRWVQDEECLITEKLLHTDDIDITATVADMTDESG